MGGAEQVLMYVSSDKFDASKCGGETMFFSGEGPRRPGHFLRHLAPPTSRGLSPSIPVSSQGVGVRGA